MYAKLSQIEILSSYITDVSVGDVLTVQALVTNPLDWHHFYEKISTIKKGDRSDFTVVTREGDRLVGMGDIVEVEKWSDHGHYGFKIKVSVKKQKSLTDRRTRMPPPRLQKPVEAEKLPVAELPRIARPVAAATITAKDMADFTELLKGSLAIDMA